MNSPAKSSMVTARNDNCTLEAEIDSSAQHGKIPPEGLTILAPMPYHHPSPDPHKLGLPHRLSSPKRLSQRLRLSTALPRKAPAESWRSIGHASLAARQSLSTEGFYARR